MGRPRNSAGATPAAGTPPAAGTSRKVRMLRFCAGAYGVLKVGETPEEIPGELADALVDEGAAEEL